ncbi:MAG: PilT/PilU family type 4a pilus ATPase [Lentisphaerae bacterium]|nr:PilT/PilU family type 4a pilus ATPase [Lentisphaerota bacterium]
MALTTLHEVLKIAVENNASDIHVKENAPVYYRIDGTMVGCDFTATRELIYGFIDQVANPKQREMLDNTGDLDLSHREDEVGRFRVNIHRQRGLMGVTFRWVKNEILNFEQLGLPPVLNEIAKAKRGIIIITGTTGSGKSTTMAAILQYVNTYRQEHVITIEDPIEYEFEDDQSIFEQREVGLDTDSFFGALKHALRQDPDIIMVGEMRDRISFEAALQAADTGHLVITTLHASNASQTITRIMDMFEKNEQDAIREALAANLCAVISQRLVPMAGGVGRAPVNEIMLNTPIVTKLIQEDRLEKLSAAIQGGQGDGMMTFNQCLLELVNAGRVDREDALAISDNPEGLKMNFEGIFLSADAGGGLVG